MTFHPCRDSTPELHHQDLHPYFNMTEYSIYFWSVKTNILVSLLTCRPYSEAMGIFFISPESQQGCLKRLHSIRGCSSVCALHATRTWAQLSAWWKSQSSKKGKEDRKEGNNFCRNRKCNLIFLKRNLLWTHPWVTDCFSNTEKIALFLVLISEKNDEMLLFN